MLRFDGWERVESWLRELPGQPAGAWDYLTLVDRGEGRGAEETVVGRYERNPGHDPYTAPDESIVRWVTDLAEGISIGQPKTLMRLRTWLAKATATAPAGSRQFVVYDDAAAVGTGPATPQEAEAQATIRGLRGLGDHYDQGFRIVLGAFERITKALGDQSTTAQVQLLAARSDLERMHRSVLSEHRQLSETDAMVRIHEADARVRENAVGHVANKLGNLVDGVVRGLTGGGKIDPALEPAIEALSQNQALRAALADPKLQALLRDAEARDVILGHLAEQLSGLAERVEAAPADNGGGEFVEAGDGQA